MLEDAGSNPVGGTMKRSIEDNEIKKAIKASKSLADVCRFLGIEISGSNYRYLHKRLSELGLVYEDCFDYKLAIKDHLNSLSDKQRIPDKEIFCKGSSVAQATLRKRARQTLLPYKCVDCDNEGEHNGKPLVLQLDHENGIRNDNRKENLKWKCPNCHSQTDTYSGRTKYRNGIRIDKRSKKYRKYVPKSSTRKVDYELVLKKFEEGESRNAIAKDLGVSQRAIAKIVKKFGGLAESGLLQQF